MVSPLKDSILHPGLPRVRFGDLRTAKSLKKWFSFNVQGQETLNVICPIVQGYAACIRASMPDSINTRSTMDKLIFFIWIFAQQGRDMKSSSSKGWKKRGSFI